MIDIGELVKRMQLLNLQARIEENDAALDLARGLWEPREGELLPIATNTARRAAYSRALKQMQSLGPRVMETKLGAALGQITWSGKLDGIDEALAALDLRALAANLLTGLIVTGFAGGYVYTDERGRARITRLGGYVEPYVDPDDVDHVLGLYQAWQTVQAQPNGAHVGRWSARVYDWSERDDGRCDVRQWRYLTNPWELGNLPTEEFDLPTPRYALRNVSQEGWPVGEILGAMPQFRALWATEARLVMSEELSAFPMMRALGDVDTEDFTVGPSEVVTGDKDADVGWMEPGNLDELRKQRELRIERLTADLSLPSSWATTQAVSAESSRERNVPFRQNAENYARDATRLLTDLVGNDYLAALGLTRQVEVVVLPTLAYDEGRRIESVISLRREGLLPLEVAAAAIQPFFPTWTDEALNGWVAEQTAVVRVEDFDLPEQGGNGEA
ncbi:MAG TPA: hypothetical protein VFN07_00970 [Trueperaceae bacterium]|nr:hypothetical protein [Trueperaceae bacterium]